MIKNVGAVCFILILSLAVRALADEVADEKFQIGSFVGTPPLVSSIFGWIPFKLSYSKKSLPLSLKVRAVNRVVFTKKDSLLPEIENVSEYKKEQEKQFEQPEEFPTEATEVSVNEPDKMYQRGEEPKIFLIPKLGDTVTKIGGDSGKVVTLAEESEQSSEDSFSIKYEGDRKTEVGQEGREREGESSKPHLKVKENGIIDSWNGGDSKEQAPDDKDIARRILESDEVEKNGTEAHDKRNMTEVNEIEENVNLQDLEFQSHQFRPGKSKIRTYNLAWMDPSFLEKEEFSVRLTPQQRSDWRDKLTNLSLLEERRANEHRDYGSSYILPVLKIVDYDNTTVPLAFNDIPVNVAVAFNFLYLANFDSEMMEFSMDVEMEFSWIDIRLVNNYTKPIRIREKPIIEQIWRPDPYIVNSKHSYFHYVSFPNIRMRITPEGLVTYTVRVSSVCSCFMSFCLYPHDRQECDLRISSIAYSNQYVKFHWHSNPIRFQSKITLPELHITKIKTEECHIEGKLVSFIHPYAYLFVGLFTFLEMLLDLLHDAFDARIKFIYTPKFYVKTAFFLAFSFCYPQVVLNWMQFFKVKRCHAYVPLIDGMLEWICAISATVYHFINSKTPMNMYITPTVEDVRNISSFPKEVYLPYFQSEVIYESLSDKK
uniref:Neur_chan_LBD domain-containing protein n=1 Tax=Caenorhabditis japonica TaxID=281687 RepID=A0A8R1E0X4_CAEJA